MSGALGRYLLAQSGGWLVLGLVLAAAWRWAGLPWWVAGLIFAAWVIKDALLYPLTRHAYAPGPAPTERLVGSVAVVLEPLRPHGYVRLGGEHWRAELESGGSAPAGARVTVVGVRGLTLVVRPEG